jgi:CobQ-like glutamine amidotransferase family enzyme
VVEATLRVCALYPDLMNIYADRGNLLLLERRCRWRGLGFEALSSHLGERLDPEAADLFYIGGGQDRDQ